MGGAPGAPGELALLKGLLRQQFRRMTLQDVVGTHMTVPNESLPRAHVAFLMVMHQSKVHEEGGGVARKRCKYVLREHV